MTRVNKLFRLIGTRPTIAIKFVLALVLIIYGLFVMSPFYIPGPGSPGLQSYYSPEWLKLLSGLFYAIPGAIAMFEIFTHRLNLAVTTTVGTFTMFLAFVSYTFVRVLTGTLLPITWLFPLACGLISAILTLAARWNKVE